MKLYQIALFTVLTLCVASAASAQYGLYGSPDVLQMPQQYGASNYAVPAGYPNTAAPQAVQPSSPANYQPPATYQPYQSGAQYRYPSPYARPSAQINVAMQEGPIQPIPAPPSPQDGNQPPPAAVQNRPGPGMMSQMNAEQGDCGCGPYRGVLDRYEQAACGNGVYCGNELHCPWYASLSGLVLGRSHGRRLWTSYVDGDLTNQLTHTQFDMQWKWGGEVRFGRRFCCCCVPYALEAIYWTTEAFSGHQYTLVEGGHVSTPLDLQYLNFGTAAAQGWFDGAEEHRLWRRDEFHNVEVNLVREQLAWARDSSWDIGWSVGVRYFRFEEELIFGSLHQDCTWGQIGAEAYFNEHITNNLVGVQFGFDAAYNLSSGVRLFITPKVGLYNNYMDQTFRAYVNDGRVGSGPYGSFPVHSTRNCVSFLTQIDVGADWQFSRNWSARIGYRLVAATGLALADEQFPQYMCDTPEIANIQHYDSLVLHGAFCGVTYNF